MKWVLSKVPSLFSSWYWTEERLSKGLNLEIRPRHASAELWYSAGGSFKIFCVIENRNLIPVTIDRILGEFSLPFLHEPIQFQIFKRLKLAAGEKNDYVPLIASLNIFQLKRFYENFDEDNGRNKEGCLSYHLEVDCNVRNFSVEKRLDGISHIKSINKPNDPEKLGQ